MRGYLITGGGGFIGSSIAHHLVAKGFRPRILDNFSTGRRENLADIADRIELIEGDVRDPATAAKACEGMKYVLHQAAIPSVPRSMAQPIETNDANVGGTLNMLVAARDAGVRRFVYAGSSSVYGESPTLPKVETQPPDPLSPYAIAKLAGELYCRTFSRNMGLETVVLRYFNVFGPRQDPHSQYAAVIPKFLECIARGESPTVYGDGTQSRDFTFVDNVVAANLLACSAPGASGQVINVACGERFTLIELCAHLCQILGREVMPERLPARPGEIKHSLASIEKARQLLGYEVVVPFQEGLRRLVAWSQVAQGHEIAA
jgi:nucleoside-diphosphate-sugar epimerase